MQRMNQQFQIFVQLPGFLFRNPNYVALSVNPSETIENLKHSLLSSSSFQTTPQSLFPSLYFSHNGRPLDQSATILSSKIKPFSTLSLQLKLFGGGGDGGSTCAESRDCYLNMYAVKKPDKVDPNEKRLSKWTTCALSFEPLKPPCVIDRLGNVFNKEALVKALLGKNLPKSFGHIKGLKDMITVQLSVIPGFELDDHHGSCVSDGVTRFQCPISGLEFNGKYKFFALKNCGHVLSSKALKEVKSSSCLICHKEFLEGDKIVINGTEEEVAALREKLEEEKCKLKEKKHKKLKNGDILVNGDGIGNSNSDVSRLTGRKHAIDVNAVEKPTGKLEVHGKAPNGVGVAGKRASDARAKRFKAVDAAPPHANKDVYASIFTSSRKSEFKETYSCRSLPLGRN